MNFTASQTKWIQPERWYQFNCLFQQINRICTSKPNQCTYYINIGQPITTYYWQYSCIALTNKQNGQSKTTMTKVYRFILCFYSYPYRNKYLANAVRIRSSYWLISPYQIQHQHQRISPYPTIMSLYWLISPYQVRTVSIDISIWSQLPLCIDWYLCIKPIVLRYDNVYVFDSYQV